MDVSFAPVNTLREALDDANVRARGLVLEDELGREHIAPVVRFLHEPAEPSLREPALGEHNALLAADHREHLMGSMPGTKEIAPGRYRADIGRTYDDFIVGHIYEHRPGRTITEADNIWFTLLTMNQHPLHFDAAYAAETEFKKPLVNSCLTLSIVTGMSVERRQPEGDRQSRLEQGGADRARVRRRHDLRRKRGAFQAASKGRAGQGLVTVRTRGLKADGTVFMTFERTVLVPMSGASLIKAGSS